MIKPTLIVAGAITALLSLAACEEDTRERKVTTHTSPGGFTFNLLEIRDEGDTDVSLQIAWPTDWTYDATRNQAVPHVATEVLLAGGTQTRSPQQILEFFEDSNAEGYISSLPDYVVGELFFTDQNRAEVIAVAAELLSAPTISPDWMDRTKTSLQGRHKEINATAANRMWSAGRHAVFGDTPLVQYLGLGTSTDIANVNIPAIEAWHADTFTQTEAAIAIVGAISAEEAGGYVDTLLSGLPKGTPKQSNTTLGDYSPRTILLHDPSATKTSLGFLTNLPHVSDGQGYADMLLTEYLGQSGDGPMFNKVRTDLRATYRVEVGVTNYNNANRLMYVAAEVDDARLAEIRDAIVETYEAFRTTGKITDYEDHRQGIADYMAEEMEYFDVAAFAILLRGLRGQDQAIVPTMAEHVLSYEQGALKERLLSHYAAGADLVVLAVSPNADALPGACVITDVTEAADC